MQEPLDFLAQLDAEISAVTSKSKLEEEKAKLLKNVRNVRASAVRQAELANQLTAVNAKLRAIEWQDVANVALFAEQHCSCGSTHTVLLQFMREEVSTARPPINRLSKIDRTIPGLPSKVMKQISNTTLCVECAKDHGFEIALAKLREVREVFEPSRETPNVH